MFRSDSDSDSERGLERSPRASEEVKQMALVTLMEKSGYRMVQENGQRKYGPPPGWEGPRPPRGCEVFVGKIPREIYEDELVPLFETSGKIYEFRLMMEFSGTNRGYAFVMYTDREAAHRAIQMLNNYEIRPGKFIGVCVSLDNCRLFIGSIPKDKSMDEVKEAMKQVTEGVVDVIMYPNSTDRNRNRGFAFIEYESHKAAALARRKLIPGTCKLWGQNIQVDWAKPEKDVSEDTAQRLRVLCVRNLMTSTTEETLFKAFSSFNSGCVERVKKLGDYAFIRYHCREDALAALYLMNGAEIDGATVEVTVAKGAGARDGSAAGRKHGGRRSAAEGGIYCLQQSDAGAMGRPADGFSPQGTMPHVLGRAFYPGPAAADLDRRVFPLLPDTPLSPTSLQSLKQSQIVSAVSLLELYCHKRFLSPPEYRLYSTLGSDGQLLLLYEVVVASTKSHFIPDKLCVLLDDARELAAQTALWNLDPSFLAGVSGCCPPLVIPPSATGPGVHTCINRAFSSCLSPPPSTSPFLLSPPHLSPLPTTQPLQLPVAFLLMEEEPQQSR